MKAKHVIGALALVGVGAGLWWLLRPETAQERTAKVVNPSIREAALGSGGLLMVR
jgi:hypothetical protein